MMTMLDVPASRESDVPLSSAVSAIAFPEFISQSAQSNLARMFRDPYLLEQEERIDLIEQLRDAVALNPEVSQLRVLLGMALCVNYEAQTALEELREAVRLAPDSFIAHLKLGELMMRLRICLQAQEETRRAAELATTALQSDLARRQAATIRKMIQDGIERGGYGKVLSVFSLAGRLLGRPQLARRNEAAAALDSGC